MKDFRRLKVWEKAHQLALATYQVTSKFPREEIYGITSQVRRASVSIPANIAEGCGREGNAEFARYLQIAFGSASELENHFLLALDLGFIQETEFKRITNQIFEVKRMLTGLIQKLKADR